MLELVARVLLSLAGAVAEWLLRLLTLGRHPREPLRTADAMSARSSWVAALGFLCTVGVPLSIVLFIYG
jgi:hypothetical protein